MLFQSLLQLTGCWRRVELLIEFHGEAATTSNNRGRTFRESKQA